MSSSCPESETLTASLAERRLALRVPAQLTVTLYEGLRRRRVELLDVSYEGCRLRSSRALKRMRAWLFIPAGVGGRLPHPVRAQIAWTAPPSESRGACQTGVRFVALPFGGRRRIERVLEALVERALAACVATAPANERRGAERLPYARRVISRGGGAPRVLLAHDLSRTGVSVEARRPLPIGARLQLALHAGSGVPLVVQAEVVRSSTDGASALTFRSLTDAQLQRLDEILDFSKGQASSAAPALMVSEVS